MLSIIRLTSPRVMLPIGPLRHAGRNSRSGARFGERRRCRVALRAFQVVL
jgi:hypothetical protein